MRTPLGSPRTVAGVSRRPWWPFPFSLSSCGYSRLRSRGIEQGLHLRSDRARVLCPPLCPRQPCGSVRTAHGPSERTPLSERPIPWITRRRLDDWDGQRSTRHPLIKCTSKNSLRTKGEDGGASEGLGAPRHDARHEACTTSRRPARASCTPSMRVFFVSLTSPPGAACS